MVKFLGFEFKRAETPQIPALVPPQTDDGAVVLTGGSTYGTYVDLDGSVRSEAELINKYRQMAEHPEVETAIDDIVNESIIMEDVTEIVKINLERLSELPKNLKTQIEAEFKEAIRLLSFNTEAFEIFKRWYIDGRLYFHCMVDPKTPQAGIQELRFIDPKKIRKIREVQKKRDTATNTMVQKEPSIEYFIYNDRGFAATSGTTIPSIASTVAGSMRIAKDSILQTTSGLTSVKGDMILSYLHKAIKPLNMLRAMEDSLVIYRISRAPERRIFYIDVGNLPKLKAEQYLRDIMAKFKNKVVYDSSTGEIRDDRKFMSMLEDFWFPRRENGRGTEVTTLPGGQNLGQIEDIIYFQKKLFNSLNVPVTRLEPEQGFGIGRATEVSRDEVKFAKFVRRLRAKFARIFSKIIGKNLVLKGVMSVEDWENISQYITYQFAKDNYYDELKNAEVLNNRMALLNAIQPFVGIYYDSMYVKKNILRQDDAEIMQIENGIVADATDPIMQRAIAMQTGEVGPLAAQPTQMGGGQSKPKAKGK